VKYEQVKQFSSNYHDQWRIWKFGIHSSYLVGYGHLSYFQMFLMWPQHSASIKNYIPVKNDIVAEN